MLTKSNQSLCDFLAGPVIGDDEVLCSLIRKINDWHGCLLFVTDLSLRKLIYIHPSCKQWFGYSVDEFMQAGPDLIYRITDEASKTGVVAKQVAHTQHAKETGFSPCEVIVEECPALLRDKQGRAKAYSCLIVVLTYTRAADMEYVLSVFVDSNAIELIESAKQALVRIKERHNAVYQHKPLAQRDTKPHLLHITSIRYDKIMTRRELQVVQLLSQGLVTKEIACRLGVSYHTIETYRKRLLEKFQAKNVAELIKKVSKVYWLE